MRLDVDAVLFDLDGTLVGARKDYIESVVGDTLNEFGTRASWEDTAAFWYESDRNPIIRDRFGLNPEDFWEVFRRLDTRERRTKGVEPYHDTDMLSVLNTYGIPIGIVSSAPPDIVEMECGKLDGVSVDQVVIANSVYGLKDKPDPAGLVKCAAELDRYPHRCVYIGNGKEDISAAKNAGMTSVHLDRGEYPLYGVKPDFTITTLHQLAKLLGISMDNLK
jgi:pyrophosphatase PpaX